ncbi:G protein-coupled receptor kinase 2 [Mortierella sp. GBA35]|nr:G protein-coupled receptor kinase 2 [Mortierella sp. GBA35]
MSRTAMQDLARGITSGLDYHRSVGIVHRDIKPTNILMIDLTSREVRIADLGKSAMVNRKSKVRGEVGTPGYMASEIDKKSIDNNRVDCFSFGCFIHYMIRRRIPDKGVSDIK